MTAVGPMKRGVFPLFTRNARPACVDYDPELWFPLTEGNRGAVEAAKAVCERCPLMKECLQFALDNAALGISGIWGGATEAERRAMVKTMQRSQRLAAVRG